MRRVVVIAVAVTLLSGMVAASVHDQLDKGPGMIGSDSMLYGLETAWDNAAVSVGLKRAGDVAQERAAEAEDAQAKGNHAAAERAANEMSKVAQKAKASDADGLQKAEAVLQEVQANAPAEAQQGLQTALDNVRSARERAGGQPPAGPGDQGPGDQGPNSTDELTPDEVQNRIDAAEQLREQGRQEIQAGNDELDAGNYEQAEQHFQQAEQYLSQAKEKVAGLDADEAQQLRTQLEKTQSGATEMVESMQAYQNGNETKAEDHAQQAQEDFQDAQQGGGQG